MGFTGFKSYHNSDMASDLVYDILQDIGKRFDSQIKGNDHQPFNTDGCVNIALFTEAFLDKADFKMSKNSTLYKTMEQALELLKTGLREFESSEEPWKNKEEFVNAYCRMIASIERNLKKVY